MDVLILGLGKIGKLHKETMDQSLEKARISFVDPLLRADGESSFAKLADVPIPRLRTTDLFLICTPTSAHMPQAKYILEQNPSAKIIVEKPCCTPGEFAEYLELQKSAQMRGGCLVTQNAIARSQTAAEIDRILGQEARKGIRVESIYVEFTKNRLADEVRGRSVDNNWQALGYEFFHMASLALKGLGPAYLSECRQPRLRLQELSPQGFIGCIESPDSPKIDLYSSMSGQRGWDPPSWVRPLLGRRYQSMIAHQDIKAGCDFRFRVLRIKLSSGDEIIAAFEYLWGDLTDAKNRHAVFFRTAHGTWRTEIRENLIKNGLLCQIHECLNGICADTLSIQCTKLMEDSVMDRCVLTPERVPFHPLRSRMHHVSF